MSSYQAVEDVLYQNEAGLCAAEAHGLLTGLLCVNQATEHQTWCALVFGDDCGELSQGEWATIEEVCDDTKSSLDQADFSFDLFLPADSMPLSERAYALAGWCRGFLYGLAYLASNQDWPEGCAEILRDLTDISQLDPDASGESDEEAYAELSEFVRVSVHLIRGEMQTPSPLGRLH